MEKEAHYVIWYREHDRKNKHSPLCFYGYMEKK